MLYFVLSYMILLCSIEIYKGWKVHVAQTLNASKKPDSLV